MSQDKDFLGPPRTKSPQPIATDSTNCLIRELNKKRGTIKTRLTVFAKFIASLTDLNVPLTHKQLSELKMRQNNSQALLSEFNNVQGALEEIVPDSDLNGQIECRESFEESFYSTMIDAQQIIDKCIVESSNDSKCNELKPLVKLPTISLPSFDGSFDTWLEFRNIYISMIHSSKQLDNIQKFYYLRSALTNNASEVIKSIQFTPENYDIAWDLIESRFNNTKLLIHNHVKALFSLNASAKESPLQIRKLIDTVLKNLRSLNSLGEPTEYWDTLIIYIIVSKLDSHTEKEWEQYKMTVSKSPDNCLKLSDLIQFLRDRADMLEMVKANHNSNFHIKGAHDYSKPPQKVHSFVSAPTRSNANNFNKRTRVCSMCSENHSIYACNKFLELSAQDKLSFINTKNLCKNCLRVGHAANACHFGPCRKCNKKHNSLLHSECDKDNALHLSQAANAPLQQSPTTNNYNTTNSNPILLEPQSMATQSTSLVNRRALETVLLSTALVEIVGSDNNYYKARALLDSGSQHCIITSSLFNKLNALPIQSIVRIAGVGEMITKSTHSCKINIRSLNDDFNTQIMCMILPSITTIMPAAGIDVDLNVPRNIKLADPSYCTPSQIDLLIGADHFWDLLLEGRIRLPEGPYLQNTKLGWIVSGPIAGDTQVSRCCFTQTLPIDEQLRKFWEIEEIPKLEKYFTADERACENIFNETTKRLNNGRFCVRIPLKESANSLGDSYTTARNRFLSLERKLERLPHYKQMYSEFIHEYLDMGHMSRINNYNLPCYFLPHHGVFRENSITTKLRVVFNASQKTSSGVSLNDIQLQTPVLQNNLFSILLRFRQYKYVACADIEKMFRQIEIHEDQRNLQLILWRDNPSEPLDVYQLNTVTYGTASAPYLSIRCVRQLGLECEDEEVSRTILNDFYVDDLITGSDSAFHLSTLCNKVTKVCLSGCLPLRKWISNSPAIASSVGLADSNINNSKHLSLGENCASKTLGLGWFNKTDQLHFTSQVNKDTTKVTKRFILSVVSQIYDPLGLLSPVVIVAKVLLQTLWLSKVDWDDSLPNDVILRWEKFLNSLSNLPNLRIPRHALGHNSKHIELHLFCDASLSAYGSCAYIRTRSDHRDVTVRLLCAKTRVSPLQTLSIPRLELSSVLIGARLMDKILKSLRVSFDKIVFWTDSTITLGWLRMCPHKLKTFVQNRVVEISELAGNAIFLHVRSENNPADLLSRGCSLDELTNSDLWWHGPLFLRECDLDYSLNFSTEQLKLPELKVNKKENVVLSTTVQVGNESSPHLFDFSRFSSFSRMQRTYAYVLRFIHNARVTDKQQRLNGALSTIELNNSLILLTKTVQKQSFPVEYDLLINKKHFKTSRSLSSLNIFLDNDDIIRVGGRLVNSLDFSYSKKHPAILCSKHYFTQLLFRYEHFKLLHAGPLLLLAHIRNTWWPLRGRNIARKTVRQCVKCSRLTGKTYQPIMGNLPKERLEAGFPFIRCGVDYAGPLYILNRKGRGSKLEKCYLCLFVCFATRALHLELVTSLSTEYYLMALKRFISRRGKPVQIFSDNGRNFVGSAKELTYFLQDSSRSIIDFASDNHIELKFICPYSAHQGGLWEKGIAVSKRAIMRVVGNANLTYEELSTVLAQIEAVLNSRPMYPMSSDPNDFAPLTPAHFLIGRPLTAPACEDLGTAATTPPLIHTLTRYKRIELLRQHFWRRWSNEYIAELQKRTKWQTNQDDIKPDTLVVIKEDNQPPLKWQLGRVLTVFPGRDNVSRVANIKTATGIIKRAFTKICPLPVPTSGDATAL